MLSDGARGGREPFERLRLIRDLASFPDMLVSCEYGNAFNRRFHQHFVEAGAFTAAQPLAGLSPALAHLSDPQGWVGVYGLAPFVWLIDHNKLNGLPVPRCWSDLADPCYRGQIILSGWQRPGEKGYRQINSFVLLSLRHLLGDAGLRAVISNLGGVMHSAQMPRLAGGGSSAGGIYILPWSLADLCPRRDVTAVIWPQEGALSFPLWLTVKSKEAERLAPLLSLFYGSHLAITLHHNRYLSLSPSVPSVLPQGRRLHWLGWERLRHRATALDIKNANRLFHEVAPCRS